MDAKCNVCGESFVAPGTNEDMDAEWFCRACLRSYPASLLKATGDHFDYALGLRNGTVVRFTDAKISGAWVTLTLAGDDDLDVPIVPFPCPRGLDVRVGEITWCCDAPWGS